MPDSAENNKLRYPIIPPSRLSTEQKGVHDHITSLNRGGFGDSPPFKWADDEGALIGPFTLLLYAPDVGTAIVDHGTSLSKDARLPARVKELAKLAVGAHFEAAYELYVHSRLAAVVGLDAQQVEAASRGEVAAGLTDAEIAAFRFAAATVKSKGPVPEPLWTELMRHFDREQATVLIFLVGTYAYICMALNAAAVKVPEENGELADRSS